MKIIVVGSRGFKNETLLTKEMHVFVRELGVKSIEVVSGTARGADKLGERYAKRYKQKGNAVSC